MEGRLRELLPCPFCGSNPTLASDFKPGRKGCQTAMVRCYNCHSDGYISDSCLGETEQTAIDKWNTRATDQLMEEMARALDRLLYGIEECDRVTNDRTEDAAEVLQKYREATNG